MSIHIPKTSYASRQHEVVDQVRETLPLDRDARLFHVREKSDAPTRPGGCCCAKNTSLAGPSVARQLFTRRCNVRNCPSSNWPE
jgi:hypothetical protein